MTSAHHLRRAAAVIAGGVLLVVALHFARGDRFRLYTSPHAARCWDAVGALTPQAASVRLTSIDVRAADADAGTDVVIGYRMDRLFAGLVLEARCSYPPGALEPSAIVLNGEPIDPARLDDALEPPG